MGPGDDQSVVLGAKEEGGGFVLGVGGDEGGLMGIEGGLEKLGGGG